MTIKGGIKRLTILFFIVGSVVGSFLTVVGIRLPKSEPFVYARSRCETCDQVLKPFDLIPILSYISCKGSCRYCHQTISPLYVVMELTTGLMWTLMYLHVGTHVELIVALLMVSMLHIVVVSDVYYMVIPNQVLLFFFPLFIFLLLISPQDTIQESLFGSLVGFGLLYAVYMLSRGGLGGGDVKLFAVLGFILGVQLTLLTLFLACVFGTVVGGALILMQKHSRREPIPFGPFIAVAAIIAFLYGEKIIHVYPFIGSIVSDIYL